MWTIKENQYFNLDTGEVVGYTKYTGQASAPTSAANYAAGYVKTNIWRTSADAIYQCTGDGVWTLLNTVKLTAANAVWVSRIGNNSTGDGSSSNPYRNIQFSLIALHAKTTTLSKCLIVDGANGNWNEATDCVEISGKFIICDSSIFNGGGNTLYFSYVDRIVTVYSAKFKNYTQYVFFGNGGGSSPIGIVRSTIIGNANRNFRMGVSVLFGNFFKDGIVRVGDDYSTVLQATKVQYNTFVNSDVHWKSTYDAATTKECKNNLFYFSKVYFYAMSNLKYSLFVSSKIFFPIIASNVNYNIVSTDWAWLQGYVLYDGKSTTETNITDFASIQACRMYEITSNPNNVSVATLSVQGVAQTSGKFVTKETLPTTFTMNGLVLKCPPHDISALRFRHWISFPITYGATKNFEGVKLTTEDPFIDSTHGNYTLKPTGIAAKASINGKPVGCYGIGYNARMLSSMGDFWLEQPPLNFSVSDYSAVPTGIPSDHAIKTRVLNWVSAILENVDILGSPMEANGEFFALESNRLPLVINPGEALTVGSFYHCLNGAITLTGSSRVIGANQPFRAGTGETSFTTAYGGTVRQINPRKLCVWARFSVSEFAESDVSPTWMKFIYGVKPMVNFQSNDPATGVITASNGENTFDASNAFELPSYSYFQFGIELKDSEMIL